MKITVLRLLAGLAVLALLVVTVWGVANLDHSRDGNGPGKTIGEGRNSLDR